MSELEEMLMRTELKYVGVYLLYGGEPGAYILEHDETEEELTDRPMDELQACLKGLPPEQAKSITEAAQAIAEVNLRAGYYPGLKAGARLLLHLLDDREIIF